MTKRSVAYSVVAVDPGTSTGLVWALVGRSEVRRLGVTGALSEALRSGRLLGEEVRGVSEFESADQILAFILRTQRRASKITSGRVVDHQQIVIEDFILRERTKDRSLLAPVRLTAMVEFGLYTKVPRLGHTSPQIVKQSPSDAKSTVTDERLKRWGFWKVGDKSSPHVRDAMRHLIVYLRRNEVSLIDGSL